MNSAFILVIWDEGMWTVRAFSDQHEGIEALKDAKPHFTAYLYQCNPDGAWQKIEGW